MKNIEEKKQFGKGEVEYKDEKGREKSTWRCRMRTRVTRTGDWKRKKKKGVEIGDWKRAQYRHDLLLYLLHFLESTDSYSEPAHFLFL